MFVFLSLTGSPRWTRSRRPRADLLGITPITFIPVVAWSGGLIRSSLAGSFEPNTSLLPYRHTLLDYTPHVGRSLVKLCTPHVHLRHPRKWYT